MSNRLLKLFNHRAVDTCCPAFFTQKFKIFLRFSSDQIGEKIDRKTQNKQKGNKMKLKTPKTKEQARNQAINFSLKFYNKQFSYFELMKVSEHFEKSGKQFGLLDEFKENGVI